MRQKYYWLWLVIWIIPLFLATSAVTQANNPIPPTLSPPPGTPTETLLPSSTPTLVPSRTPQPTLTARPTLAPNVPVLIVPGIAGTYSTNVSNDLNWLTHRGVHPNELRIDPLGRVYDDMIKTFINLGYKENKDLFVVNYDWRLLPGPIDNQFDGHVSGLNAQFLADEQFHYAVDYLGWYLRKAAEVHRLYYGGELQQVHIISHSTGGLVARTYLQSDAYGGVYDPVHNYRLPTIRQFIMVGVPNRGASKAWNPIHNNWIADTAYRVVLSKIINRAYHKVLAGVVIQGPDYNIDLASISPGGVPDPEIFIEQYVPTTRALLATYDFIDFGAGYVNLNNAPALRNGLALDLNNGLDLLNPVDYSPFATLAKTTVICGGSETTAHKVVRYSGIHADDVLLPFDEFEANDAEENIVWYEDRWLDRAGDETVPLESCLYQFLGDSRVDKLIMAHGENTSGKTDHTGLMSNVDVQSAILEIFTLAYSRSDVSTGTAMDLGVIASVISDPVGAVLVDGQGHRLGYNQAEGAITEIPGSLWFGDYDGMGYIFGGLSKPLHLELTGLGEDYYVMVSVGHFGRPAGGVVSSGFLAQSQVLTIPVEITTRFVFLPLVSR